MNEINVNTRNGLFPTILGLALALALPARATETPWSERFPRPAFLVQKPTALYEAASLRPLQTVKTGDRPHLLDDDEALKDGDGSIYYPTATGELILAQSPPGSGIAERKGLLVYLPPPNAQLKAHAKDLKRDTVYMRPLPRIGEQDALLFLAPEEEVLPRYITVDNGTVFIFVEHITGAGWVLLEHLYWPAAPVESTSSLPPPPVADSVRASPVQAAVEQILDQYNEGVRRARDYYRVATGHAVPARTFRLTHTRRKGEVVYITLDLEGGHIKLEAEDLLPDLFTRKLGRKVQVIWP